MRLSYVSWITTYRKLFWRCKDNLYVVKMATYHQMARRPLGMSPSYHLFIYPILIVHRFSVAASKNTRWVLNYRTAGRSKEMIRKEKKMNTFGTKPSKPELNFWTLLSINKRLLLIEGVKYQVSEDFQKCCPFIYK